MTTPATLSALLTLAALACVPGHHLAAGWTLAAGALAMGLVALYKREAKHAASAPAQAPEPKPEPRRQPQPEPPHWVPELVWMDCPSGPYPYATADRMVKVEGRDAGVIDVYRDPNSGAQGPYQWETNIPVPFATLVQFGDCEDPAGDDRILAKLVANAFSHRPEDHWPERVAITRCDRPHSYRGRGVEVRSYLYWTLKPEDSP